MFGDKKKREQFASVYDKYIDKIYRFVYLKVGNQSIAEDITSKVFLKGWEAYSSPKSDLSSDNSNISAFIYKIARNSVIDYYRTTGRSKMVSSEILPKITDNRTDIHNKAIIESDVMLVKSAMINLNQDYQDAIIWHYLDGLDVSEIALAMDKSENNVRVILHRGLGTLRKSLKGKIQES